MYARRSIIIIVVLLCCLFLPESTHADSETGFFPVYNFTSKQYNAVAQNWSCLQDKRGVVYFANNQGILEYDGKNWNLIRVPDGSSVRSMAMDSIGRIFIGSVNEFGYLKPDSIGRMQYVSISEELDEENSDFGEVWETNATGRGIVFQSYHSIFIYDGDSVRVIPSEEEIHESFYAGNNLYVRFSESGLARLEGDEFVRIPGEDDFSGKAIYGMVELRPGRILIATQFDGLYELSYSAGDPGAGRVKRIRTKNDKLLQNLDIYNMIRVDDNKISLGTFGYGAVIIDTTFEIIAVLDKSSGLQDEIVQGQYMDRAGNLWLALSVGVSRVEINSPLTHFTDSKGLPGTIQAITRFNNTLYVTTNLGLFYLDKQPYNSELSGFTQPVFKAVPGFDIECWDMITYRYRGEEILLVLTNSDVREVSSRNQSKIILSDDYYYDLYQSKLDSARIFVGLGSGLASLYRDQGEWIVEGNIEGVRENILSISEDHLGNVWMGTPEKTVLRMYIRNFNDGRIGEYSISRYGSEQGLPEGPFLISEYQGPPVVATNKGLYKYILQEERFEPDSAYGIQFADGSHYIHRVTDFTGPRTWLVAIAEQEETKYSVGYLSRVTSGTYEWVSIPFARLSEGIINAIYPEENGIAWMGGVEGLYRYDSHIRKNYQQDYNTLIRQIEFSDGGLVFGGSFMDDRGLPGLRQSAGFMPILPFSQNSLVFNYSAQPGEDESFTKFSYFLEGNDNNWSDWSAETKKEYTNLREGKYTFRVKARNIYRHESREADYEFTILAPWYRKWWAFIIYVILAAFIVYSIVKIYTRQLRQIIRERTAEVVMQKEVIEAKNKDIMASIQYAEKIQRAMLPPEDDLNKLNLDGFILFLPRDVVSGDFYWLTKHNGKTITVAADCTGHGVPGAFMSMLGVAFLNKIVEERNVETASVILDELRAEVIAALKQKGYEGEQKDGMDLALHIIDHDKMTIEFAGANNPLLIVRNDEIIQIKADRMPIGIHERSNEPFKNNVMEARKGDVLYIFSDGFQDQFGGPNNKKFMIKNMKELLLKNHARSMEEQKAILRKAFFNWIEPYGVEQIDDVILIGIRI